MFDLSVSMETLCAQLMNQFHGVLVSHTCGPPTWILVHSVHIQAVLIASGRPVRVPEMPPQNYAKLNECFHIVFVSFTSSHFLFQLFIFLQQFFLFLLFFVSIVMYFSYIVFFNCLRFRSFLLLSSLSLQFVSVILDVPSVKIMVASFNRLALLAVTDSSRPINYSVNRNKVYHNKHHLILTEYPNKHIILNLILHW
jgi:hypothetical protein